MGCFLCFGLKVQIHPCAGFGQLCVVGGDLWKIEPYQQSDYKQKQKDKQEFFHSIKPFIERFDIR